MGNWTYDPESGRYIQGDPIGLVGGINFYGYANVNPTNLIDHDGQFAFVLPAAPAIATALGKAAVFVGSAAAAAFGLNEAINHYNKPPSDAHDPDGAKAPGKSGAEDVFGVRLVKLVDPMVDRTGMSRIRMAVIQMFHQEQVSMTYLALTDRQKI